MVTGPIGADVTGPRMPTLYSGHTGAVVSVAVTADGRTLISGGGDGTVRTWDAVSGAAGHTLTGHTDAVESVAVTADGRTLISGGDDGTVRTWDAVSGAAGHTRPVVSIGGLWGFGWHLTFGGWALFDGCVGWSGKLAGVDMGQIQVVGADGVEFVVELADGGSEGPRAIADGDGRGVLSFDGVSDTIRVIGSQVTRAWEAVRPDEASVQFGLKLTAKTGRLTGLLVDGGGEATLLVTMTWKGSPG